MWLPGQGGRWYGLQASRAALRLVEFCCGTEAWLVVLGGGFMEQLSGAGIAARRQGSAGQCQ